MATTYKLKRKLYAFNLTRSHFGNMTSAFKNKQFKTGFKEMGKTTAHGLAGGLKMAGGVAGGIGAVGLGAAALGAKSAFDTVTGQDI